MTLTTTRNADRVPGPGHGPRRSRRPGLGAALAVVVGVVATGFGAGLGVRHVQKEGLSLVAVTGLLTLVAGLCLLTFGTIICGRLVRAWRRLWLLPGVVLGAVVIWSTALAVMYAVVPSTPLGSQTPAARGLTYRTVTLTTTDGVRLSAWWLPSSNRAAVVLLHGSGDNRAGTLGQAAVLARHGYGVLMLDARGHGDSGGRGMDLGWYGDADVHAAVGYLQRVRSVDPTRIAVVGLSMGGEEAIGAAGTDPRVRAVVAEGATGRTAADKRRWLPGGISGAVQRQIDRLTYGLTELLTPAPEPSTLHDAVVTSATTPFLLVTAGQLPDEARAAADLREAAPDRVEVWTVPGAGHTPGLETAPREWEQRVIGFLDRALGVAG